MSTTTTNDHVVADAFGVETELLPLLPELYANLPTLGAWLPGIVEVLQGTRRASGFIEKRSVVDLGCGQAASR